MEYSVTEKNEKNWKDLEESLNLILYYSCLSAKQNRILWNFMNISETSICTKPRKVFSTFLLQSAMKLCNNSYLMISATGIIDFRCWYMSFYVLALCNNGCNYGRCTRPNICTCNQGYHGPTCVTRTPLKSSVSLWRRIKYWYHFLGV